MKSVLSHCLILLLSRAAAASTLLQEQDVTTPINSMDHPMIRRGLKKSKVSSPSECIQIKDGDYNAMASVVVIGICSCKDVEDALANIICEFSFDECYAEIDNPSCHTTLVEILATDIDKKDASKKINVASIEKGLQNELGSPIEIKINNYRVSK